MANAELHSFLFADICGFSQLTEADGDEAAAEIAIRFYSELSFMAVEHGAEVVHRVGDGAMIHSRCAAASVRLGLDVLSRIGARPPFPQIHAGIHTGTAIERDGDWWGGTVNIAARVAAASEAGQLLLTEATRLAAGRLCPAELQTLGPMRFKNISTPIWVYSAAGCNGDALTPAAAGMQAESSRDGRAALNGLQLPAPWLNPGHA